MNRRDNGLAPRLHRAAKRARLHFQPEIAFGDIVVEWWKLRSDAHECSCSEAPTPELIAKSQQSSEVRCLPQPKWISLVVEISAGSRWGYTTPCVRHDNCLIGSFGSCACPWLVMVATRPRRVVGEHHGGTHGKSLRRGPKRPSGGRRSTAVPGVVRTIGPCRRSVAVPRPPSSTPASCSLRENPR